MKLGFVYFDRRNAKFKKELENYNGLLKSYFEKNDSSLSKELNSCFSSLVKNAENYEILSEKDVDVYNAVVGFMATELSDVELDKIKKRSFGSGITSKISKRLPGINTQQIENAMEKSINVIDKSTPNSIETIFVPSVINY